MTTHTTRLGGGLLALVAGAALFTTSASAQQIFWSNHGGFVENAGSIWSGTVDGNSLSGSSQLHGGLNRPIGLDTAGNQLYWAEDGVAEGTSRIAHSALSGGAITTIFNEVDDGFTNGQMLSISGGKIFWTDFVAGVHEGNPDGTGLNVLGGMSSSSYTALDVVDGTAFYGNAQDNGVLYSMNTDGTNDQELATNMAAADWRFNAVAVSGDRLYYTDTGAHTIQSRALDGSDPQLVVDNLTSPLGVAAFEGDLYWVGGGNLGRVGVDGSNPVILETGLDGTAFGITVIPEPGTYALMFGLGIGALVLVRRRFQK